MNFQKFREKTGGKGGGAGEGESGGGEVSREREGEAGEAGWWELRGKGQCKLLSVVRNGASAC